METTQHTQPVEEPGNDLVNKLCGELRPLLTSIIEKILVEKRLLPETSAEPAAETPGDNATTPATVGREDIEKLERQLLKIEEEIQVFAYKDRINKELHEELQKYKNDLRRELLSPVLKNIIHWYGRVADMQVYYERKNTENADVAELFPALLQEYKNLSLGLLDLLYDYDIEPVEAKEGEAYQPKIHKALQTIPVEDAARDRTVASCQSVGFRDVAGGRLLKQAEVDIYKMKTENIQE